MGQHRAGQQDVHVPGIDYDFTNQIDRLNPHEIDELPIGAIQLDRDGTILCFNAEETALTGFSAESVVGKNFFQQIAPCTKVQQFHGQFTDGVARRSLHVKFRFTFKFGLPRGPIDVWITLFYSVASDTVWVFVRR